MIHLRQYRIRSPRHGASKRQALSEGQGSNAAEGSQAVRRFQEALTPLICQVLLERQKSFHHRDACCRTACDNRMSYIPRSEKFLCIVGALGLSRGNLALQGGDHTFACTADFSAAHNGRFAFLWYVRSQV